MTTTEFDIDEIESMRMGNLLAQRGIETAEPDGGRDTFLLSVNDIVERCFILSNYDNKIQIKRVRDWSILEGETTGKREFTLSEILDEFWVSK